MNYVKGYTPPCAMSLPILLLAATAAAAQQAPKLEVSRDTVLLDERFQIRVSGLPPARDVTIRMNGNRGAWQSSGTFHSDAQGRLEIADPMKLIWSATGEARPGAPGRAGPGTQQLVFSVEVDGQEVAADTLWRRVIAANVRIVPVRERGLVGTAYFPPDPGPHPAVLVLAGAAGGIPAPVAYSGGLASHGYAVLGLAYFNSEGLPSKIENIPLEYFTAAVAWLKSQPNVDSSRIGVLGGSRGAEIALLLGSTFPQLFRAVVAMLPTSVVWPGMSDDSEAAAWTLQGKPLPHMRNDFQDSDTLLSGSDRFRRRLRTQPENAAAAAIPVERLNAPLLLLSAKDDQMWPSAEAAERVVDRLRKHHFAHPLEHYSYENAGHMITRPYVSTTNVQDRAIHPVSRRWNVAGGTPEGQARANEDSWQKLLTFLDKYLRH